MKKFTDEEKRKEVLKFEEMIMMSELKALSKYSMENPLTDEQFNRMIVLKNKLFKESR